jgi:Lon protease (S16) C-terminal proteolytic domain
MAPKWRPLLALLVCLHSSIESDSSRAELWVCPQSGQPDLYTDHGSVGCRQLSEASPPAPPRSSKEGNSREGKDRAQAAETHETTLPVRSPAVAPMVSAQGVTTDAKISSSFSERSLLLPIVAVSRLEPGVISGSWIGLVTSLTVSHAAHGRGPEIETDGNLQPGALNSLRTAITAASSAVGYDPKYLKVRLLVPTVVDGPSAGSMYAVGIASALLSDPIRRDVCMSGTIEPNLQIKPVGRLADKMNACKVLSKTTLIVPDGLDNSHLSFLGMERSVHVVEVHTLSDAYLAATGQSLRPFSSF